MNIDRIAMTWLYPRLLELPPEAWESVIGKARATDFETTEWFGVVGGVAAVAWLVGADTLPLATQPPVTAYLVRFLLALPLLVAVVGPIYLRRTRRGLDRELARWNTRNENAHSCRKEA